MYSDEQTFNLNKQATEIIKLKYNCDNREKEGYLISKVCDFFDFVKNIELTQTQLRFLYKFANAVGVPQYYEMLLKQNNQLKLNDINLNDLNNMLYNSSLVIEKDKAFHKYQKMVYEKFNKNNINRFFLTAPTSFGKTFIVSRIIKKLEYKNVVLIFPTLSLLAENYIELVNDEYFNSYKIHTLSDDPINIEDKNLFVFTPERFLSMTDKIENIKFDFIFMDEIYKIDNQFVVDNETIGENERDLSYRVALQLVCENAKDILLAGPYIEISDGNESSIHNFLNENNFEVLSYNDIEIVGKSILSIDELKNYNFEGINFRIKNKSSENKLKILLSTLHASGNIGTIIYTNSRLRTERIANWLLKNRNTSNFKMNIKDSNIERKFSIFMGHLKESFSEDWILYKALSKGVGIHHGYIPKYIQKEIINFFNEGVIDTIISTTTITEGINTSAKNMIVMSDQKGNKPLKKFDAQNIAGRAGRFMHHYKGFVFSIDNDFERILDSNPKELKNLEYDILSKKTEVDILTAPEKYLTDDQKISKKQLYEQAKELGLNIDVVKKFKTIKMSDKIKLYEKIVKLPKDIKNSITKNILNFSFKISLNWENFDTLLKVIFDIIENEDLKTMIKSYTKGGHSALTVKVASYIENGFPGVLNYEKRRKKIDSAVKETSKLTFNIFKYHLVKYLGAADILLRFNLAQENNSNIDDVPTTLTTLLSLLEYNCVNGEARKISDYGVPFKVLKYLDTRNRMLLNNFDEYELYVYRQLINKFKI